MADNITSIAKDLASDMPDVQEHAIEAESKEQEQPAPVTSPDIETDKDGNPILKKDGTPKKKRGRKAGVSYSQLGDPKKGLSASANPGSAIAESIFAMGQLIGGEEWQPIVNAEHGINERKSMVDAWERYCEAKGIDDFPPGIAVIVCTVGYAAPRFVMPKTKSRFTKVKEWGVNRYIAWKTRGNNASRSDSGDN